MDEWKELPASEYCINVADGTHDSPKPLNGGEYLITSKHITGGKIDLSKAYMISRSDFDKVNLRSKVDKWDVLITMIGTVGEVVLVDHKPNYAIKNIGLFKCGDEIKARWLKYHLQSPIGKAEIQSRLGGTTQEYIALGELRKLPIPYPPLPEQKAIASVLSSLDDKIDLLHRQNKTLEAMAETLFRQWFVEEAQEDWEEGCLGDVISVKGGTTPSTKEPEYWNGNIHWTSPRDLSNHASIFLFDTGRKITEKGLAKIGSGLLQVGTVLLSSRAPIGYLAITEIPLAINQGYIAIVCDKVVSNNFIYLWCKANMENIKNSGNGSVFQEIAKSVFKEISITIPPKTLLDDFEITVKPIFSKIKTNQLQIHTLEKLRDTLLPKLMTGEVRVET